MQELTKRINTALQTAITEGFQLPLHLVAVSSNGSIIGCRYEESEGINNLRVKFQGHDRSSYRGKAVRFTDDRRGTHVPSLSSRHIVDMGQA